jgi:DNA polymerase III delta subunit
VIHYFYGSDTYAARQAIAELVEKEAAVIRWLDADELNRQGLSVLTGQTDSLFGRLVSVIRDVSALPKHLQQEIVAMKDLPTGLLILWDRKVPDKRSALFKALKTKAREFPLLDGAALTQWLQEYAQALDLTLSRSVAQELIARVGNNKWRLLNELNKLALLHNEITPATLAQSGEAPADGEIFSAIDAVARKNKPAALGAIAALLEQGHGELYILSMLAYQFKSLSLIRQGIDQGLSEAAIAKKQQLHPYVVQKNMSLARQFSFRELLDTLTKIMATDFAIKQGKVDPRTGLTMLTLSLMSPATVATS